MQHQGIDVALSGADGAEVDGVRGAVVARVGDGDGVFVDIEADVECATVPQG